MPQTHFYVYLLLDPRKKYLPFYVGKGCGNRYEFHESQSSLRKGRNLLKNRVIQKIRDAGLSPRVMFWQERLDEISAFALERELIGRFGRRDTKTGILTNMTDGGEGVSGYLWTEANRERMRKRMTGAGSPTFGVGHTDESRKKMSISQKERVSKGLIARHSEEHKQRLREDNPGGKATRKMVLKLLPDATVVETFESMIAAAKTVGWTKGNFGHALVKDGSLPLDGYFYRYEYSSDITPDGITDGRKLIERREKHSRGALSGKSVRKVVGEVETIYESVKDVARQHPHLKYATIWGAIKNNRDLDGATWSYN